MSKKYFYGRVSTKDQNLARQLAAARAYTDIPEENIYCDKESGKNFEREQYQVWDLEKKEHFPPTSRALGLDCFSLPPR